MNIFGLFLSHLKNNIKKKKVTQKIVKKNGRPRIQDWLQVDI